MLGLVKRRRETFGWLVGLWQDFWQPPLSIVLSQKVCVHDPPLPRLGLGPHPLDIVREVAETTRRENFVLGTDRGTPINVDVGIVDRLE
jgi:hypothetical protein